MKNSITIYIPNPTTHQDGLGDVKSGRLIIVRIGNGGRKRYVVSAFGIHGGNGKVWNIELIPEREYRKEYKTE